MENFKKIHYQLSVINYPSFVCAVFALLFISACSELEKPKPEPFYAETLPPPKQEFRWSNGKMPKSFDPALASAAPETDIVRAIFEGLTETDSKTLNPVPAVAEKWESSEDFKTWTFHLRKNSRWSNGEAVTAADFARSWKRLADLGERVPHHKLLKNIVGMRYVPDTAAEIENQEIDSVSRQSASQSAAPVKNQSNPQASPVKPETQEKPQTKAKKEEAGFGVKAIDEYTLQVSLIKPDKNFPALVAHPVFLPVYGDGKNFETGSLSSGVVTNGAFRIFSVGQDGITLDRAEHYWNKENVELERVRFVPQETAEKALEAYRAGEIDAVTNADFQPLALKLLTPFDDFRRTTHSAINFYEFNRKKPPFDDRRVREAMAISIERERLTEGASVPALSFMPFDEANKIKLAQDAEKAKRLLAEAGFPNGERFPTVRLIVNRNNVQQRIARVVAKMWKENLNIETEIIVRETAEIENIKKTGDFDVLRRGVVIPTADETANMLAIFTPKTEVKEIAAKKPAAAENKTGENSPGEKNAQEKTDNGELQIQTFETLAPETGETVFVEHLTEESEAILTEQQAIMELPAIPLYFPTSYSLVKPYVLGFETNTLDAPSLKEVRIDNNWQPIKSEKES
jgi:oligopeptide transport system substrate-binding protein